MRNLKGNYQNKTVRFSSAFTLVELVVVAVIIAILGTVGVVGYNGWRQATVTAQQKNDLNAAASAMENYRNFNKGYPSTIPSSFNPSSGVTLVGGGTDDGVTFCINATNSQFPDLPYHIDSTGNGAQPGICTPAPTVTVANYSCHKKCGSYTKTFSWNTIYCSPNMDKYRYRLTVSPASYDSGWIESSYGFYHVEASVSGNTYTVTVQAACYDSGNPNSYYWSASGSGSYYRPFIYALHVESYSEGGTTYGSGSYYEGSIVSIVATPNVGYDFTSWTGDAGCSGAASHDITVDANKTCTPNFTPTP